MCIFVGIEEKLRVQRDRNCYVKRNQPNTIDRKLDQRVEIKKNPKKQMPIEIPNIFSFSCSARYIKFIPVANRTFCLAFFLPFLPDRLSSALVAAFKLASAVQMKMEIILKHNQSKKIKILPIFFAALSKAAERAEVNVSRNSGAGA